LAIFKSPALIAHMRKITPLLLLLLLSFFAISCDPKDDEATPAANGENNTNFPEHFGAAVQRDFIGQVVDINNLPVSAATVKIGNATVQTDINGVFIINQADVQERFAYVTATKAGFVDGSRSLVPTSGKNNIKIMLIPMQTTATVASGAASEVALPNGTKVKFDGAFMDANGSAYSGNVNVSMFHLKSSDANINALMPGMLYAQGEDGGEKVLQTFGMLHVELRGSGGQELQISANHTAEISMMIDDTQMATAPSEIPLWHFDEAGGYWKQEGSAAKTGNQYVGTVSHFSWWNCDAPFETNSLTIIVKDANGLLLKNIGVGVSIQNVGNENMNYTNDLGRASGMVPANQTLTIRIYDPCGNMLKETSVAPLTQQTETTITLDQTEIVSTLVKGKIVKCDGTNVSNGYVILEYGAQMFFSDVTNGNFEFAATICGGNNAFTVRAYDVDNFQTTGVLSNTFTAGTTDLGILPACNAVSEYIIFQIDNYAPTYIFDSIDTFPVGGSEPLTIRHQSENSFFAIAGSMTTPGIYTGLGFQIGLSNFEGWGYHSYNFHYTTTAAIEMQILKYGNVGEYIDIRFHADGNSSSGQPGNLNGYLHVLRD